MGIKHLNRVLRTRCPDAIKETHLWQLKGKKIVIDTSIYMYRFKTEDALIENMYLMISLFKFYKITPIFVFDGRPPEEKLGELQTRQTNKKNAEERYYRLKNHLNDMIDNNDKHDILMQMDIEKRKFVRITNSDKESVKNLMDAYGVTYIDADGEADELCYMMVRKKLVDGCLSEDMDMFVYGCDKVYRYLSLLNGTLVVYDMKKILAQLNLTQQDFREICILAGTDYNLGCNIYKAMSIFRKYQRITNSDTFYCWLEKNNYIEDKENILKIEKMFNLTKGLNPDIKKMQLVNRKINKETLRDILMKDGFVFIN